VYDQFMNGARFRISVFLSALFGCWALMLTFGIAVRSPLTVVLFACLYMMGLSIPALGEIKGFFREMIPVVVSTVITFLLRGAIINGQGFHNGYFRLLSLMIILVGYWLLVRLITKFIMEGQFGKRKTGEGCMLATPENSFSGLVRASKPYDEKFGKRAFVITAAFCLLFYLPYFLYEFPGVMTADSLDQFDQITYFTPMSNHHPVVHTLLIGFFYRIGLHLTKFHDKTIAISLYTAFQMIFMSLCCGAVVKETLRLMNRKSYRIVAAFIFFYAFMPFNGVYAVTIWKDVPFAGVSMLLCVVIAELLRKGEDSSILDFAAFTVLGILFCLMRSNALYAFLVFALFFLLRMMKGKFTHALISVIVCILVVFIIRIPVFGAFNIKGADFTESLSVPLQQVARVLVNERQIDAEDMELIDKVIDRTYIRELYAPWFADNIKELVRAGNPHAIENNKTEYFGLWLRLGLKYPGDYIDAWFDLTGGYIYTNVNYMVAEADGIMRNKHGLTWSPIIGGKFIKVKEILIKLQDFMPIYGMLFTAAIYTWALAASFIYAVRRRKPVLLQTLMLLLVATLLIAAPVVDFRYAYAIVMTWPLWLLGTNKL